MRIAGYQGKIYELENKEMASGGEGKIYRITGMPTLVAKIYNEEIISRELEEKIIYMVQNQPGKKILSQVAWPLDILVDQKGCFCGFVMQRIECSVRLQSLYEYPQTTYKNFPIKYKVIVAQNICVVLEDLHAAGYIFGDFNPANIGVHLKTGEVTFFDMDTCHFKDRNRGHTYRCMGACDGYIAPELLEKLRTEHKNFKEASLPTFTEQTDNYALAQHIFRLLMNGVTPCEDGYRFEKIVPNPPALPRKAALSAQMHELFSRAIGNNGSSKRPTPREWYETLGSFEKELKICRKNPAHNYRKILSRCPYCDADNCYEKVLKNTGFGGKKGGNHGNHGRKYRWMAIVIFVFMAFFLLQVLREKEKEIPKEKEPEIEYIQPEVSEEVVVQPTLIVSDCFSGIIESEEQIDSYQYIAPADGIYRFDCKSSSEDCGYFLFIWTEEYKIVESDHYKKGVTAELESGKLYYLEVKNGKVPQSFEYQINIGVPQEVETVYGEHISGQIEYMHQENWYVYIPEEPGEYIFTAQGNDSECVFYYMIFDSDKLCIDSDVHSRLLYAELNAGETYYIKVMQGKGYPDYDISISQK